MTNSRPLAVGDRIHGYCGGYFGRDHYDCGTVEAIGSDWLVARTPEGKAFSECRPNILMTLAEYRDNEKCTFYGDQDHCTFEQ